MSRHLPFLAPPMRAREQTHRRHVLWGIGALLLLSLSPVVGHHLSARADAALVGQDHAWAVCLIALHTLLAPVHGVFHALLLAGLLYAFWDRTRAVWRLRQSLAMLTPHVASPCDRIGVAMRDVGLESTSVLVVDGLPNPAFTAGWWKPRIYIARDLGTLLSHEGLVAVLSHEAEHVRRRDPLRLTMLRFLGCTLFWIPAFRRLAEDMADEAEIAADDVAAREHPLSLASAILSLAARPYATSGANLPHVFPTGTAVGLMEHRGVRGGHDALLEWRVRRLAGDIAVVSSHLTRRSLLGAAAVLAAVWISGIAVAHPMPTTGVHADAAHCDHPGKGAWSHLFCRNGLRSPDHAIEGSTRCPHAHPPGSASA
ncbi:MAG: M56 family metallopeptidase [Gemmatimonas sp.]